MPVGSDSHFQPQQRLHPLSWLFALTTYIRQLIVPIAAFLFLGVRNDAELWGALVVVPLLLGAVWQQWIYRYGFGPRGLVIHEGLFFRNVRQIEYPRIENIDVERGVLHRLFGVAQVSIATSTGGKPEASIRVLSLDAVQELRDRIFARGQQTEAVKPAADEDEVLLQLPPSELVIHGLIDNRGVIVVAAIFGFLYQTGLFELTDRLAGTTFADSSFARFAALGIAIQSAFLVAAIAGVVLVLRMLSIAMALVTLFDFTLTRHESDFRIRHGLLTRVALNLRVRRIQSVHQTESLLHRWFRRVSLRADLAGDSSGGEEGRHVQEVRTRWLAPICTPEQARTLIAAALPDADLQTEPHWQPLAPRARARLFRRGVYFGGFLALCVTLTLHLLPESPIEPGAHWIPLILLVLVPLAWLRAHVYVKHTRWALTQDAILFRYGWLTRRLVVAPRNRLQSVQLSTSPFDRRHRMASVSIDTAGAGAMRNNIRIPLLSIDVAQRLATQLYRSDVSTASHLPETSLLSGGPR